MKSILIVEDSKFLGLASERALTSAGHSVTSTDDGELALLVAETPPRDLILLDMLLPPLGGPGVLRVLRNDPAAARIPVAILSSLPQKNESRLKKDGAAAYFQKSKLHVDTNAQALVEVVRSALAGTESATV